MLRFGDRLPRKVTQRLGRCGPVVALALAVVFLVPAGARAGSLALLTCGGGSASEGWSAFAINAPSESSVPTCTQSMTLYSTSYPPGLRAFLSSSSRPSDRTGLQFTAPSGNTIVGGDITLGTLGQNARSEAAYGYPVSQLAAGGLENVFWETAYTGLYTVTIPAGVGDLAASVVCRETPESFCHSEELYVLAADILLTPNTGPSVSALSGSLASGRQGQGEHRPGAPPHVLAVLRRATDLRRTEPPRAVGAVREVRRPRVPVQPEPRATDRSDMERRHHQPLPSAQLDRQRQGCRHDRPRVGRPARPEDPHQPRPLHLPRLDHPRRANHQAIPRARPHRPRTARRAPPPRAAPRPRSSDPATTRRESIAATLATHEHHDQNIRQAVEALNKSRQLSGGLGASPFRAAGRSTRRSALDEEDQEWDS